MEQKLSDAALRGVPTKLRGEECARGMEQRSNYAAVKDVLNEGCQTRQELHISTLSYCSKSKRM